MKKLPLTIQLGIILIIVLIIPGSIMIMYNVYLLEIDSKAEITSTVLSGMEVNRKSIENLFDNTVISVQRLVSNFDFNQLSKNSDYETDIKEHPNGGLIAMRLKSEISTMVRLNDFVHSVYFLQDNSDYVVSSDRGIVRLDDYYDTTWLETAKKENDIAGSWVARKAPTATLAEVKRNVKKSEDNVISYVYRLSKLTTSTRGTVVVNITESKISQFLNGSKKNINAVISTDGLFVSHPNKNYFMENASDVYPVVSEIGAKRSEYFHFDNNGDESLISYVKISDDWTYICIQSLENLTERSKETQKNMIMIFVIIIIFGALISVYMTLQISKPMKLLVDLVQSDNKISHIKERNELLFLNKAFEHVKEQEKELKSLLERREKDTIRLTIRNLLAGDYKETEQLESVKSIFYGDMFVVVALGIDQYYKYRKNVSFELRAYQRYLIISECEKILNKNFVAKGVRYVEDKIAIIVQTDNHMNKNIETHLVKELKKIQQKCNEISGYSVSIGVSKVNVDINNIHVSALNAIEALSYRLIQGFESIIFWDANASSGNQYYFPSNHMAIINNLFEKKNADITKELEVMEKYIRTMPKITVDNVRFIYNQLIGMTIKNLEEKGFVASQFLGSKVDIYTKISELGTLAEITAFLDDFYKELLNNIHNDRHLSDNNDRFQKIMNYFETHYKDSISFEDVAQQLEISYSYMRKIIKEKTGESLLDCLCRVRIRESKKLLLESDMTIVQIAEETGFANIQSLNRFFKKFEGITPGEYKLKKQNK